jgi:glycerol uptake operon antiterminator
MKMSQKPNIRALLKENQVILAVKDDKTLQQALKSKHKVIFLLYGDLNNLTDIVTKIIAADKVPFVHIDMINGLSSNPIVVDYFKKNFKSTCGIITTKAQIVKKAIELDICVVQRYFIIDSMSVMSAMQGHEKQKPDAIEIMPGIIPSVIKKLALQISIPIIAGGLINTQEEASAALKSGALAISTSRDLLW